MTQHKENKKSIIKIISNIVSTIIMIALGSFIVVMLVFMIKGMNSKEPPTIFNYQLYIVQSNSMSPTFETGSLIIIKKADNQSIQENDIITYRRSRDTVATTHRVVEIIEDGDLQYITRGDANNVEDPMPVSEEDVMGKVVFWIPYIGYILGFIRTKQGLLICIVLPALIIILTQIIKLIKAENKKECKPTIEELQAEVQDRMKTEPEREEQ